MDQLIFELKMFLCGFLAFVGAFVITFVNILVVLGILLIIVWLLLPKFFLTRWFRNLGISVIIIWFLVQSIFPYGHDNFNQVVSIGNSLLSNDYISTNLSMIISSKNSFFLSAPESAQGHRYIALNLLGKFKLSQQDLAIKIGSDLNAVFPIAAKGQYGKGVMKGNIFALGQIWSNPVESGSILGHYFTLKTLPTHALKGKAHHGIVKDSSGRLWLFQYGEGLDQNQEPLIEQLANYPLAQSMWVKMAENIRNSY